MYTLRMYFHPNTFLHVPPTAILDPTSDLKADQEPQKPQQDVVISPACLLIPPSWPAYSSCLFFFLPSASNVCLHFLLHNCVHGKRSGRVSCEAGRAAASQDKTHPPTLPRLLHADYRARQEGRETEKSSNGNSSLHDYQFGKGEQGFSCDGGNACHPKTPASLLLHTHDCVVAAGTNGGILQRLFHCEILLFACAQSQDSGHIYDAYRGPKGASQGVSWEV